MKNIITIICFLFAVSSQAQLLATLTTTTQGGVVGKIENLTPQVAFYQKGTPLAKRTTIFNQIQVTPSSNQTIILTSNEDDAQFSEFVNYLTSKENYILRVGHKAGSVKSHIGRSMAEWIDNKTVLEGKTITKIVLTYTKVEFVSPGRNLTNDGNWTDFTYDVTLAIYGTGDEQTAFLSEPSEDEFTTKGE